MLLPTYDDPEYYQPTYTLMQFNKMELIMKYHPSIIRLAFGTAVVVMSVLTGLAQCNADQWLRVLTEEESLIDVNRLSLALEANQVISARFRTRLATPEPVPGNARIKYETRLDFIQFSVKDRRYRISESNLLDVSGNVVFSYPSTGINAWKPLRGRTANRLFNAASQLRPFGIWKVVSYRYASGDPASDSDSPELRSLVGSNIQIDLDRVAAGKQTCSAPIFDAKTITNEDFIKRVGSSITSLGISTDRVNTILLVCGAKDNFPSQTIILSLTDEKALMLWDGIFLELERSRNHFLP